MAYIEVLMPYRPVIDRAIAFYVFEEVIGRPLKIKFVSQNSPLSNADLEMLSDQGVFVIGVGSGLKYTDRGFGSETSAILHELRSVGKIPNNDPVFNDLARMMDTNNDHQSARGGYLRRQPYAVTWIMRQAYRLGHNASEHGSDFCFSDEEVVRRAMHVVCMYVNTLRNNRSTLALREQAMNSRAMALLPKGKARTHQGPMTVSRYVRDMVACGLQENEIVEKARWFVRVHDRAQVLQAVAKKMAESQSFDTFPLDNRDEEGTWVDSNDPCLFEELVKNRPLVVMRNSIGNIIIMSKNFDLSAVAKSFLDREPDQWYYQSQPQMLANGTEQVRMDPSGLSRNTIESDVGFLVH